MLRKNVVRRMVFIADPNHYCTPTLLSQPPIFFIELALGRRWKVRYNTLVGGGSSIIIRARYVPTKEIESSAKITADGYNDTMAIKYLIKLMHHTCNDAKVRIRQ